MSLRTKMACVKQHDSIGPRWTFLRFFVFSKHIRHIMISVYSWIIIVCLINVSIAIPTVHHSSTKMVKQQSDTNNGARIVYNEQPTTVNNNNNNNNAQHEAINADEQLQSEKLHHFISSLVSHMQQTQHQQQQQQQHPIKQHQQQQQQHQEPEQGQEQQKRQSRSSFTSTEHGSTNLDPALMEKMHELLKHLENNKPTNELETHESLKNGGSVNFKNNAKALNTEEMISLAPKMVSTDSSPVIHHQQSMTVAAAAMAAAAAAAAAAPTTTETNESIVHKSANYETEKISDNSQPEESTITKPTYLMGMVNSDVPRKLSSVTMDSKTHSGGGNTANGNGGGSGNVVQSVSVSGNTLQDRVVNGAGGTVTRSDSSIYELLTTLDNRMQKLQESVSLYGRQNTPKVPPTLNPLNPIYSSQLNMLKSQVLSLETSLETKCSHIQNKLANIEIEDGIWKKTTNWKLEEVTSKLSQSENKLAFSHEQIMNKLDLFERNIQIVTNDFFHKFFLINEKLNKLDLSLQTRWNDVDMKIRQLNRLEHSSKHHKHNKLEDNNMLESQLYPSSLSSSIEHLFRESFFNANNNLGDNAANHQELASSSSASSSQTSTAEQPVLIQQTPVTNISQKQQVPVEQSLKDRPSSLSNNNNNNNNNAGGSGVSVGGIKTNWPKLSNINNNNNGGSATMVKANNVTKELSDRIKFTQRFLKLINQKQNQTLHHRNKLNNTFFIESLNVPTVPGMINHDASIALSGTSPARNSSNSLTAIKTSNIENGNHMKSFTGNKQENTRGSKQYATSENANSHVNHRNLDKLEEVKYADLRQMQATASVQVDLRKCEQVLAMLNLDANYISLCSKLLESSNNNNLLDGSNLASTTSKQTNFDFVNGADTNSKQTGQYNVGQKSILEKRDLNNINSNNNQDIALVDGTATREKEPVQNDKLTPIEEQLSQLNNEIKTDTKLEELDSKFQFFSTKIIKIVQEMWLASQASENYLKETMQMANKTKMMLEEEFGKVQSNMKPLIQVPNMAEEIREPIINRLQELSTAINNSVEVILNTQAEFINQCRVFRDEDLQIYDVLEIFVREISNKSAIGMMQLNQINQLNHNLQEQNNQLNRSLEFLILKLDVISKKTIEGVRSETVKLLESVKNELHTLGSNVSPAQHLLPPYHGTNLQHWVTNRVTSASQSSTTNSAGGGGGVRCNNDCFITRDEFANICINIDSGKSLLDTGLQYNQSAITNGGGGSGSAGGSSASVGGNTGAGTVGSIPGNANVAAAAGGGGGGGEGNAHPIHHHIGSGRQPPQPQQSSEENVSKGGNGGGNLEQHHNVNRTGGGGNNSGSSKNGISGNHIEINNGNNDN